MINDILLIILIAIASNYLADWSFLVQSLKRFLFYLKYDKSVRYRTFRMKPLDCPGCLTFWVVLITMIVTGHSILLSVLLGLAGAGIATLVNRI